jgi:hypothetical protein
VGQQIVEADGSGPRCGQLHRQRDAVESPADLRHHAELPGSDLLTELCGGSAVEEQANRRGAVEIVGVVGGRQSQRLDREDDLAQEPKRLPARAQHRHLASGLGHLADERAHDPEHVFAVIHHEKRAVPAQPVEDALTKRTPPAPYQPQRGRHCRGHGGGADGREVDHPHAVSEPVTCLGGYLDGEPGLADTAGTDERDGSRPLHQGAQRGELLGSPAEAGGGHSHRSGGVQRAERWEALRQVRMEHLVDAVLARDPPQSMDAERHELDIVRHLILDRPDRGSRQQCLAAVTCVP